LLSSMALIARHHRPLAPGLVFDQSAGFGRVVGQHDVCGQLPKVGVVCEWFQQSQEQCLLGHMLKLKL
jgi:hypothetical protein